MCPADILFYGGAAGGGKTWTLLMEPIYHKDNSNFRAVMFRRTMPNITNAGSMWDQSMRIYPYANGQPNKGNHHWEFPSKARVEFASLQYDDSVLDWKSAEVPLFGFDQIEEFTEYQFWYMNSRNRSTCGVSPYIRCSCNPVPEDDKVGGWVHKLISWWLDEETGLPRPERSGVIRWFIRVHDTLQWYDTKAEAVEGVKRAGFVLPPTVSPEQIPRSLCFIASKLEDNQKLMTIDPGYYATLMAMPMVERERLLGGNWKIRPSAGNVFNRAWFDIIDAAPIDTMWVRYWDKAGTDALENPSAAYTAGVKMGYSPTTGRYYVGHVARGQWGEFERERNIKQCAELDTSSVTIYVEQEPGSGGKESARHTVIHTVPGFACYADRVRGDKYFRARPFAAMVQALNVSLIRGPWNEAYLSELHNYDPTADGWKDQVDGSSGAFNKLTAGRPLEDITPKPPTDEERQAQFREVAEEFTEQVQRMGCVFPGEA
jgi:predicted phage terminase large subunit-like protein